MPAVDSDAFLRQLRRHARRIHIRQVFRGALSGAAVGALLTMTAAGLAWLARFEPRGAAFALAALAGIAGALIAFLRRFSAAELALFLDARLGSAEVVSTALATLDSNGDAATTVRARALAALSGAEPRRARFVVLRRLHALLPLGLAAAAGLCALPARPLPSAAAPARGSELVRRPVAGLERIEALATAPTLSPADAERMKQLAAEARKLNADLTRGVEKREAQARIAGLRDAVSAARQRFGDRAERAGLEAALGALENERTTARAAKALGDGDIVAFDEEMQRLANRAESSARERAREALAAAARAAKEKGAQRLAEMLERQKRSFAEREAKLNALRELERQLGEQLGPEARRDLAELDASGDPNAARRLTEALADALSGLSAEERQELAKKLKAQLTKGAAPPMSDEDLEKLLRELGSERGREELKQQLRELLRDDNTDAERERALQDAERGGAQAEQGLGHGVPLPVPTPNASNGAPGSTAGNSGPGGGPGPGGAGKHEGQTEKVQAEELRAKAPGRWLPGAPLAARSLGRAPGRSGETANQVGTGELGSHASSEVGAVDRADIPEEYRQQVGRYFEP